MAEGGTFSIDSLSHSRREHPSNSFSDSGNPSALDGSFLLQLLQKKPQATSLSPSILFHNEGTHPYQDPAVAAIGPGFPFLPHQLLSQSPSSFIHEINNNNYSGRQTLLQMDDRSLGHPNKVSPPNTNPLNRVPREIPSSQHVNRARNLDGKKDSAYPGQDYRASSRPPPGFEKPSCAGLPEVSQKMEGGLRNKNRSKLHCFFERKPSQNEEVRSAEAFKTSSKVNPQSAKIEKSDEIQRIRRILNDDDPHRGLPDKCNSYIDERIHSAVIPENGQGDSGKDLVDYKNDDENIQILKEADLTDCTQPFSGDTVCREEDLLGEQLTAVLSGNLSCDKESKNFRSSRGKKDVRMDFFRGHHVSSQRVRIQRRELRSRFDLDSFLPCFLSVFKTLVPSEEEIIKQEQLLYMLVKLVKKEWPDAELHLYGSCANSFGVSNSDIDVCLAINGHKISKVDILLKLADILESNNLQNVQALVRARVPIVKMMDPLTGLSCDICANNLLAVVNTKLLKDYAQIDPRLRQLAFIVKHWAKSRRVNETYHGTLSSYAYVLMCIHFLQMRKPAILPCLQGMKASCRVIVDGIECAYYDKVENLRNFGARNKESTMQLLWAFFHYWAYRHNYTNDVISVRTGSIISKQEKDWTRRIGNDRHLICIEDPFEVSHDLGRVVDKFSIKILREEFERAADILQYDPNPNVVLFEPYVPGSPPKSTPTEPDELLGSNLRI